MCVICVCHAAKVGHYFPPIFPPHVEKVRIFVVEFCFSFASVLAIHLSNARVSKRRK